MNLVFINEIHYLSKLSSKLAKGLFSDVKTMVIDEYYYQSNLHKINYKTNEKIYDEVYFIKNNEYYSKSINKLLFPSDNIIFNFKPYSYNNTFLKDYITNIDSNNLINYLLNLLDLVRSLSKNKDKIKKYFHIGNMYYSNNEYFFLEDTDKKLLTYLSEKFKEIKFVYVPYIYNPDIADKYSKMNNIFFIIDNILLHSKGLTKIPFSNTDYVEILHISEFLNLFKYIIENIDNINNDFFIRGEIIYIKDIIEYISKYRKIDITNIIYSPPEESVLKKNNIKDINISIEDLHINKFIKKYNFIYMIEEYLKKRDIYDKRNNSDK